MAVAQGSTAPIKLSNKHGRNVDLNKAQTKAKWTLNSKGGYSFITSPLADHESCDILVSGSGHAFLGVTSAVPRYADLDHKADSSCYHLLLRQKKSSTKWCVSRDGQTVTVAELNKAVTTRKWTFEGDNVFVTVDILFGDINFEICDKERFFDTRYGENLKLACENRRISLIENRRTIRCSAQRHLLQGEIIILQLQPLPDASWVSCKVYLSNCSPEELHNDNKSMKLVPVTRVKRAGDLHLRVVKEEVHLSFLMKSTEMSLKEIDFHKPIYVHVELFRMKMKVRSVLPGNTPLPPYLRVIPTSDDNKNRDLEGNRDGDYCLLAESLSEPGPTSDNFLAMVTGDINSGLTNTSFLTDPDNTEPKMINED